MKCYREFIFCKIINMTEIKIIAKEYFGGYDEGVDTNTILRKFISQETVMENGVEVPKWMILIAYDHPELERKEKISANIVKIDNRDFEKGYCYEISFVDDESLLKKTEIIDNINQPPRIVVRDEDKRKRLFLPKSNITIKDNYYEKILEELKNENNLMKEEEGTWKDFINWFRKQLVGISDKNSSKYQEGRKFIEELEAELNKKTGKKSNDDNNRERERDKSKNYGSELRH